MQVSELIVRKRQGGELTPDEIEYLIEGFVKGKLPEYQISAFLMAVYFRGMTPTELSVLTRIMVRSGEVHDLSFIPQIKVDKHSTGGVGDKVSLVVAPLVASVGVPVPMVSGRALGHTGGTLDKLESIPNFKVNLPTEVYKKQVAKLGVAMVGQSDNFVPADKKLYALRDVTGTIESIPLIAASIMSKKVAAGVEGLVIDVKCGNGAFMESEQSARQLAEALVSVGKLMNVKVIAVITDMNQPLGRAVGNSLEVIEAIEVLKNQGPDDVREITIALGAYMLVLGKFTTSLKRARKTLEDKLVAGEGLRRFAQMVRAQGGDPSVIDNFSVLPTAKKKKSVTASRTGFVKSFNTRQLGVAVNALGAGRQRVEDTIDPAVGFILKKKIGDKVKAGEELFEIHYNDDKKLDSALPLFENSYELSAKRIDPPKLIKDILR
ncbi:MAG: thymidine phosphorylase [bacterium]